MESLVQGVDGARICSKASSAPGPQARPGSAGGNTEKGHGSSSQASLENQEISSPASAQKSSNETHTFSSEKSQAVDQARAEIQAGVEVSCAFPDHAVAEEKGIFEDAHSRRFSCKARTQHTVAE